MAEPEKKDFGAFYRATVAPLRRYLARIVRSHNDAEDLAHDAYQRVYQAMDKQDVHKPEAFLYTTARRLALKQIRRRQIAPVRDVGGDDKVIDLAASGAPGVERVVMARQEWAQTEAAIVELPPGCRSVLLLAQRENLSHAEIGARLGIAVSTVEKQHARALRLLRARLAENADPARDQTTQEGGPRVASE